MKELNICFVGIGSIASRHIQNLRYIESKYRMKFHIDAYRREANPMDGVDHVFTKYNDLSSDYDAVFITNPTKKHLETLRLLQDKGRSFFIEKPVVSFDQIEEAKQFSLRPDVVYYVACPLRYHAVIQYIKNNIDPDSVIGVRSISSSYLPEWRQGKDYRSTYSAHKEMGGGVSIDLIHEWDYLTYLFDWPERVSCYIGKKSNLEINSDDYAIYIAEYADKIAELHLDYFGRKTIREIELFTKEETILGDLVNSKVSFLHSDRVIDFQEDRNAYQKRELEHFLDLIFSGKAENGYHHGIRVLELTQGKLQC